MGTSRGQRWAPGRRPLSPPPSSSKRHKTINEHNIMNVFNSLIKCSDVSGIDLLMFITHLLEVLTERDPEAAFPVVEHLTGHQSVKDSRANQRNTKVKAKKPPVLCVCIGLKGDENIVTIDCKQNHFFYSFSFNPKCHYFKSHCTSHSKKSKLKNSGIAPQNFTFSMLGTL